MEKEKYELQTHRFVFWKVIGKHYCVHCGLVALNNNLSNWCADKGCLNELHPNYKSVRHKNTKLKGEV